jgi:hypothetical protein
MTGWVGVVDALRTCAGVGCWPIWRCCWPTAINRSSISPRQSPDSAVTSSELQKQLRGYKYAVQSVLEEHFPGEEHTVEVVAIVGKRPADAADHWEDYTRELAVVNARGHHLRRTDREGVGGLHRLSRGRHEARPHCRRASKARR